MCESGYYITEHCVVVKLPRNYCMSRGDGGSRMYRTHESRPRRVFTVNLARSAFRSDPSGYVRQRGRNTKINVKQLPILSEFRK